MSDDIVEVKAKKISSENVEILGADGSHIAGKEDQATPNFGGFGGGGFKVVKMGPLGGLAGLLLLPIMIPVVLIGIILLAVFAMIFGKALFRSGMVKVFKR